MDTDQPPRATQVSGETPDPSPRGGLDSEVSYQLVDHLSTQQYRQRNSPTTPGAGVMRWELM